MCMEGEAVTCDAPMCESCKTQTGIRFTSGEIDDVETQDLCPVHLKWPSFYVANELTPGAAEGLRLKDWKMRWLQK